ncbi:MAG: GNAT family N-acetyltransferase [Oscillospiraceae bacterium]|nr:GNAT family N-acetyltransferase [Oscillospiraceae bacterium]
MYPSELAEAAAFQLSCDYSCRPEDFIGNINRAFESKLSKGRRNITETEDFFRMATMGNAAIASADKRLLPFLDRLMGKYEGCQLFTGKIRYLLNCELQAFNKAIGDVSIYYLPQTPYKYVRRGGFNVRVYEQDDISEVLYRYSYKKDFSNALLYDTAKKRKDVLAVCALNGNDIIGIAGASSDSERFWQIGVDVLPAYRKMGIASEIVSALTYEVLMHGAIPYYSTWSGNITSQNTARSCGYIPVWTEMFAQNIEEWQAAT